MKYLLKKISKPILFQLNSNLDLRGGTGTQSLAFAAGGRPITTETEVWNGTSWSISASLATQRFALGGAGTNTAGLVFGGNAPTPATFLAATEEFTGAFLSTKKITTS